MCERARPSNRRAISDLRAVVARATTCAMAMLRVANCPSQDLALTNAAFVNEADAAFVPYAELGDLVPSSRDRTRRGARHRRAERRAAQAAPREHRRQPARGAVHAAQLELQRRGDDRGARVHQAAHRDGPERRGQARAGANRLVAKTERGARARVRENQISGRSRFDVAKRATSDAKHGLFGPSRDTAPRRTEKQRHAATDHGARLHPNA